MPAAFGWITLTFACIQLAGEKEIEKAVLQLKEQFSAYYEAINRFRETWNAGAEQFHRERFEALSR